MTVNETRLAVLRQAQRELYAARAAGDFHKLTFPPKLYGNKPAPYEVEMLFKNYARLYGLFSLLSDHLFELADLLGDLEYSIENKKPCALVPQTDGSGKEGDTE